MLQDEHRLVFGEQGALLFLPSAAHAETSLEFNQTFLMHYMKKGVFTTGVMDHDGVSCHFKPVHMVFPGKRECEVYQRTSQRG